MLGSNTSSAWGENHSQPLYANCWLPTWTHQAIQSADSCVPLIESNFLAFNLSNDILLQEVWLNTFGPDDMKDELSTEGDPIARRKKKWYRCSSSVVSKIVSLFTRLVRDRRCVLVGVWRFGLLFFIISALSFSSHCLTNA